MLFSIFAAAPAPRTVIPPFWYWQTVLPLIVPLAVPLVAPQRRCLGRVEDPDAVLGAVERSVTDIVRSCCP